MVYVTPTKIRLFSNLSTSDIVDADIAAMIAEVTKTVNEDINVLEVREWINYVNESRRNDINGTNTTYYVRNYHGKYISDTNNDGIVDTTDVIVYRVDSSGVEDTVTVTAVDSANGKITLETAPTSAYRYYVTYAWAYANSQTPDNRISLATACLTVAYCYAKINWGRAPRQEWRNIKLYRHMESFDLWENRYRSIINGINNRQSDIRVMAELDPAYYGQP